MFRCLLAQIFLQKYGLLVIEARKKTVLPTTKVGEYLYKYFYIFNYLK